MPYLCQDAQASFSSILALRLLLLWHHVDAADAAIHSFHCWWCLYITARQCTRASCTSQTVELLQCETPKFTALDLWPPNSPDLNSTDYWIWDVMQDCVYQTPVRDMTDLKQRLTDTWNGLSQNIVDDGIDEWRKRLRACLKEKGGHFQHLL